jgi:hypothetical protein
MPVSSRASLPGDAFLAVWLDQQVRDALDVIARRRGNSRSEEARLALAAHLIRESCKPDPETRRAG